MLVWFRGVFFFIRSVHGVASPTKCLAITLLNHNQFNVLWRRKSGLLSQVSRLPNTILNMAILFGTATPNSKLERSSIPA